jgi:hypothetical protein
MFLAILPKGTLCEVLLDFHNVVVGRPSTEILFLSV